MKKIAIVAALMLAGCAGTPKVMTANSQSVLVRHAGSAADATALAVAQCGKHGKSARLAHSERWLMSFDCVGAH